MTLKSVISVLALGVVAAGSVSRSASAATVSTSFGVSVTVQATCAVSASSMRFGTYMGTAVNATSAVSVNCTNSTPYNVGLSAGLAPGATVSARKMAGPGSSLLEYGLSSSNEGVVNWGHTVGVDTVAGVGNGAAQVLTVHGQIPAGQYVAAGPYNDTVTVTVMY